MKKLSTSALKFTKDNISLNRYFSKYPLRKSNVENTQAQNNRAQVDTKTCGVIHGI